MIDYYPWLRPLLWWLDAERAHRLTIAVARAGILLPTVTVGDRRLQSRIWGLEFFNPVGLAAGFDKNAEVADAMLGQGFGFVEVGTVTPLPQAGNPRPRVFRLWEDEALVNRLGFNNEGLVLVRKRLERRRRLGRRGIVGANIGPNRSSLDPIADCVSGVRALAPVADYLVINISSPNTPGLRGLQQVDQLRALILRTFEARAEVGSGIPLIIKIAPDLDTDALEGIARAVLDHRIDGVIATNTTTARPAGLRGRYRDEPGGLSGRPLFRRSTEVLAAFYRLTKGAVPLVGAGGISCGEDAYAKIRAGASLVQLYTALVYRGPRLVERINLDLATRLERDGFSSVAEAVGVDAR